MTIFRAPSITPNRKRNKQPFVIQHKTITFRWKWVWMSIFKYTWLSVKWYVVFAALRMINDSCRYNRIMYKLRTFQEHNILCFSLCIYAYNLMSMVIRCLMSLGSYLPSHASYNKFSLLHSLLSFGVLANFWHN